LLRNKVTFTVTFLNSLTHYLTAFENYAKLQLLIIDIREETIHYNEENEEREELHG